jgi:hypothetical protein
MKDLVKINQGELSNIETKKLLDSKIFKDIELLVNVSTMGTPIKKPLNKRLEESKFANLIRDIPTQELVVLTMVLGFSAKSREAIGMYLNAENNRIQRYALKLELQKRQSKR